MNSTSDWQPSAEIETLKRRAQLLADVRRFFSERDVLEVETPVLSQAAPTATYLESFCTLYQPAGLKPQSYYLQTSPEFAMKRLLAAGSGDIYQIAKVFRHGELGRLHNPEFTMLEWYRPALGYQALMTEVDNLLQEVACLPAAISMTYHNAFKQYLNVDIEVLNTDSLREIALSNIASLPRDWQSDRDGWLELLMSEVIEPQLAALAKPVIVSDFPASQAQLAKVYQNQSGHQVAARFEVYAGGVELANGYDECQDADELRRRFEKDNLQRLAEQKQLMPVDEHLLDAMTAGLPACTGVALGLDRLLVLMTGKQRLSEVLSFGFERS
jgi:lysyl-tRNA synthetase class 2